MESSTAIMNNKFIAVVLLIVLAGLAVTACGGDPGEEEPSQEGADKTGESIASKIQELSVDLDKLKNSKVEKYLREIGKEIEDIKSTRFNELISDFTQNDIDELAKLYYFDGTPCGQSICTTCTPSKL